MTSQCLYCGRSHVCIQRAIPDTHTLSPEAVKLGERMAICPPHDLSVVVEWEHGYYDNNYGQRGKWNQRSRATATTMRATRLRCSRCPVTEKVV